ncbi:hypothetical protein BUALT_Bualt06G0140500 [Buddleja alternifolia]|uniref:Kazal-like domain-containing protein n=1 Tax=Buddleja alternifolia TaxID=168488 RepID=A0AAV6XJC7_9LAMI|nr:hypothetical protein BUALT_Bualt06G0140500 [Buddleja alternifolia]
MHLFSVRSSSIFILTVLFATSVVRSNPEFLMLPSKHRLDNDICPLNYDPYGCPMKCFRPDPVCGVDGVTYWCGCADAHCAGVRVKKVGFCEGGNGGSGPADMGYENRD